MGVSRVVLGVAIPHLLGDPALPIERERTIRRRLVLKALDALQYEVTAPTLFHLEDGRAAATPR
jgi:betaine reductase